jgi:GNAT superfamily N-acetyltransferase
MGPTPLSTDLFDFRPLTLQNWQDFEQLFEEHGPQNGCWCMYWRTSRVECQRDFGEGNKRAFKALIESGKVPGILAYREGKAIAWCSIAPREDYPVLGRSPTLRPVDEKPVWSIICFFVSKSYRRQGMTEIMIEAAIDYAKDTGANIVEAYPLRAEISKEFPFERYMGVLPTFIRLGFEEVLSRSERRPILRYFIQR